MPTIVEYNDAAPAQVKWPRHIVSPTHASPCCDAHMQTVGHPHQDGNWTYQYSVCRTCGFAVRKILTWLPDAATVASLRQFFATQVVRGY